ncbi:5-formyltetrahydrofolate cyclo-ligase [Mangrovicella endophytica]|uniref:5-formyltetrahydrofolate cyclo-ligase n=1 Tax=Mangrovicella endophytica TaxID=2066697 RepID=UPI000C9DE855|nr:5-formyltetrahydrofolate cyclo-ligase [Mangrovicella endophytica]
MQTDYRSLKATLRADALARRDAIPADARIEASHVIAERCAPLLPVEPGTIISGFLPIRSEVDLRPLMAMLADQGARICVPAIIGDRLEFRELLSGAVLESQGFGTVAPGADAPVLDPMVMLVPMSAFDRRCHRIGYGRGFYDRAIAAIRDRGGDPVLAGVAFAVQEVAEAPADAHDVPLHMIVTEREVLRP